MMQFTGKQREEANFKALIVENYQKAQKSPDDYIKILMSETRTV